MPLSAGDKLGPYQILGPLGAGGMGEVYRALDSQLDREVAVKVLPRATAGNPELLARFDREAKILAALNHPNIAVVYGLQEFDGGRALVMELVPGNTLAARIERGAVPVEEACKITVQIADALEAAHEKGVVHRDLKPGNIMITPAGQVKVLDFGLAAVAPRAEAPDDSATLTMGMTAAGVIMGTAAYMSPEQASGLHVDKRADIWSYGVVLWEMLTGKRLFGGATIAHTLADVIRAPIDMEILTAPAPLKKLLKRCLDREIRTRLRDIGEARVAIGEFLADPKREAERPVVVAASRSRFSWGVTAAALAIAGFLGWRQWSNPGAEIRPLTRLSVDLGPVAERDARISVILSPDGTRMVFTGKAEGGLRQLYTRRLDQLEATLLTTSANQDLQPFFSPDGKWVGFWSFDERIMKVPAEGGAAIALGAGPKAVFGVLGASWGDDDNIIIGSMSGLWRMHAGGGTAKLVNGARGHQIFPQVLSGAKAVIYTDDDSFSGNLENSEIAALRFDNEEKKVLVRGAYWARYLPTSGETGHLLYMQRGTLFGGAFDPHKLELIGAPVPLAGDVSANTAINAGGGQFAFSNTGTFVYLSGKAHNSTYPIAWLDESGKVTPVVAKESYYEAPRISPDGKRLAYLNGSEVWVYDIDRATSTQLTFGDAVETEVAWTPDAKHLVYGAGSALWWIRADGAGQRQALLEKTDRPPRPSSFAPDGRLAFSPTNSMLPDIFTLPLDLTDPEHPKPGKAEPFLNEPGIVEVDPAFSPDGKFLAYASSESNSEQIFVRSFPGPGGKWKISTGGGKFPVWSRARNEILFTGGDDRIMAVDYTVRGDAFVPGKPRVWSPTPIRRMAVQQNFDLAPDGKRVVMFPRPVAAENTGSLHATFLLNFFDELRRVAPARK